jgi:exodeoxyribonuclease VII small subunit
MSEKTNYAEAFEELKKIVAEIDRKDISVDDLSEKIKRAAQLIKICKSKLDSTEQDVSLILKDLDDSVQDRG